MRQSDPTKEGGKVWRCWRCGAFKLIASKLTDGFFCGRCGAGITKDCTRAERDALRDVAERFVRSPVFSPLAWQEEFRRVLERPE
jgi:ribosomal protein S27AE